MGSRAKGRRSIEAEQAFQVREEMETDEGMGKKYTFSGSVYFNRMKDKNLYTTDIGAIQNRVRKAGLTGVLEQKVT